MIAAPWRQALAIGLLAVLPALAATVWHPKRPAWSRETLAPGELNLAMAQALPGAVWVDARTAQRFAQEHVPGAFLLNEDDWNALLLPFAMQFQPDQQIVVYCDSLECDASHKVAARLRKELGAQNVFVLKGGWQAWKSGK